MTTEYSAEIYDLATPASVMGDVEWSTALALSTAGRVLELGAGTGRITLELARAGIEVVALDSSAEMLARLAAKLETLEASARERVSLLHAKMQSFHVDRPFSLVIAPFRAFLHNLTLEQQTACVTSVFQHLAPRGQFALNVFHPSLKFMAAHTGTLQGVWRHIGSFDLAGGGALVRSEATSYDTVQRRVCSLQKYERFGESGLLESTFLQRMELAYLYPQDLNRLLQDNGFEDIRIFGGFDERPFADDQDELVVVARRP